MKKLIAILFLILVIGGIFYITTADIEIDKKPVVETIPNDRFF